MKSTIILATLFAGSLAAILPPGLEGHCVIADQAIDKGLLVTEPMIPACPNKDEAIKDGVAAFKHGIGCGAARPEPEAPPADERCSKEDCARVEEAIKRGKVVLRAGFMVAPPGYEEGVKEGIRVFKKKLGCEEEAEVTV